MKKYIMIVLVIGLFGCDQLRVETAKKHQNKIEYIQDKFGNCFATMTYQIDIGAYATSIATVPCEPLGNNVSKINEKEI